MSLWSRISDAVASLAKGESLQGVFDRLRTPPEQRVGFTIAVIALGAKMAKADGHVTRDEVAAFRQVFVIPPEQEKNTARIFNLARQDIAGFEDYARTIKRMFSDRPEVLNDLMEGLFHIALADGQYHPGEDAFLHRVAEVFGLTEARFRCLRARFVKDSPPDPYAVLGVKTGCSRTTAHAAWKRLVRETHPDRIAARGVPKEAVKLAETRLVAINRAWEEIRDQAA